jgi:hypothetical protein
VHSESIKNYQPGQSDRGSISLTIERDSSESQTQASFAQKWFFGNQYFLEATLDENSQTTMDSEAKWTRRH